MTCKIKVAEFLRRVYGANGTPPTAQTIRRHCQMGLIPADQIGGLWFIDWTAYQAQTGDNLVDNVMGWTK